jgi:hypothetical protein
MALKSNYLTMGWVLALKLTLVLMIVEYRQEFSI